jgi:hypothetical protein
MTPDVWGPPIWTLFHCLAEKIKEEKFPELGAQIYNFIVQICKTLPCPDCSAHASQFLSKINPAQIKSKEVLRSVLFTFHANVNARKKKPKFDNALLTKYKSLNLAIAFKNFIIVYKTRGNMKQLTESFHRTQLLKQFTQWMVANHGSFE